MKQNKKLSIIFVFHESFKLTCVMLVNQLKLAVVATLGILELIEHILPDGTSTGTSTLMIMLELF